MYNPFLTKKKIAEKKTFREKLLSAWHSTKARGTWNL